jgi:hypothetical protein
MLVQNKTKLTLQLFPNWLQKLHSLIQNVCDEYLPMLLNTELTPWYNPGLKKYTILFHWREFELPTLLLPQISVLKSFVAIYDIRLQTKRSRSHITVRHNGHVVGILTKESHYLLLTLALTRPPFYCLLTPNGRLAL